MEKFSVFRQYWLESERGWGIRPDGYSLHLTRQHRAQFVNEYWDMMPDEVQDEYSRPDGEPDLIEVDEATYARVAASKNGIRLYR